MSSAVIEPFEKKLARHGLELVRDRTRTLQVNLGYLCDLACRHCHLEAGPQRGEVMSPTTMEAVIALAGRAAFETIDITGGAPELVPHIEQLVARLAVLTDRLIVRTNLVALHDECKAGLMRCYRDNGVALVASLPATNASQTDAQRGSGVWEKSIAVLKILSQLGYGCLDSPLELDLVVNPVGAFLPGRQEQVERKFRQDLARRGVVFHHLFTFANVPLGRFRAWLERSGNLEAYLHELAARFNPQALQGVMCRSLISVSWDGYLHDCDFNLAAGLHHGAERTHVSQLNGFPEEGLAIANGDHCYACTAGSGFT